MGKVLTYPTIVSMLFVMVLTGCGTNNNGPTETTSPANTASPTNAEGPANNQKEIKLTFALDLSKTDSWTQAARKFAEVVEAKSDGRIKVSVHDSGTLGAQRQLLEGILAGTVHGTMATEPLSYWVEDMGLYGIPYLFRDQKHLDDFLKSDAGAELHKKLSDVGFRPLTYYHRPPRHITSNKPINSIDDLKGLKIRVPESPTAPAAFKAMGATPITMNFAELYSALETGVVDGEENPITSVFFNKLHEVQKYLAYTSHQYQVGYMIFSEKMYQSLSDADKKILDDAAAEAQQFESDLIQGLMKTIEADMKAAGVTFTNPDVAPFAKAAKTAYSGYPDLMKQWITKIEAIK